MFDVYLFYLFTQGHVKNFLGQKESVVEKFRGV